MNEHCEVAEIVTLYILWQLNVTSDHGANIDVYIIIYVYDQRQEYL